MMPTLPAAWQPAVGPELEKPYFKNLEAFLDQERKQYTIYPKDDEIYSALDYTAHENVRVVILGQDPYHGPKQAHGCSFSVRPNIPLPPSLRNIYKELENDIGATPPDHGCLVPWARQGVLLLNAVLTVRAGQANSHQGKGWEQFTDQILRSLNTRPERIVFILWGAYARKKAELIDTRRHYIIQSAHPSPLSASNGFFGSRPFSRTNQALEEAGLAPIVWQLPNLPKKEST